MSYQPPPQQPYPPAQQPPAYGPPPQQPPAYGPPPQYPHMMEPPEATSIKSMTKIAGILSLIIGIIAILGVLGMIWLYVTWVGYGWPYYYADPRGGYLIAVGFLIAVVIVCFLLYIQCKNITQMVDRRQYTEAKSKTLIWMILGFIFCWVISGILLLIAYLKYDNLIRWGQPGQPSPAQQPYYQPQPQYPPPQYPQAQQPQQPPPQQPPPGY